MEKEWLLKWSYSDSRIFLGTSLGTAVLKCGEVKPIKTVPVEKLLNPLLLKGFSTPSKSLSQNQVLRKHVKFHSFQNVNCDYRSNLRVTKIVLDEAMMSAVTLILTFLALSIFWKVSFFVFLGTIMDGHELFKPVIHFPFFASANRCSNFS
jgi:hypothetical protein